MSQPSELRFLPRDMIEDPFGAQIRRPKLVPNYEAQKARASSPAAFHVPVFHGIHNDSTSGREFVDPETKEKKRHLVLARKVAQEIVIPMTSEHLTEYVKHAKAHDLWPANEATAEYCGVPFDPKFGGEHDVAATPQSPADAAVAALTGEAHATEPDHGTAPAAPSHEEH